MTPIYNSFFYAATIRLISSIGLEAHEMIVSAMKILDSEIYIDSTLTTVNMKSIHTKKTTTIAKNAISGQV